MKPMTPWTRRCAAIATLGLSVLLLAAPASVAEPAAGDEISDELLSALKRPMVERMREVGKSKNDDGDNNRRGNYSYAFKKIDDDTYTTAMHINTAGQTVLKTDRYAVTLKKADDEWTIAEETIVDSVEPLVRPDGYSCYDFDRFSFDREGMKITASNGDVCEGYLAGEVWAFIVFADDLKYDYGVPEHVNLMQQNHDFFALHRLNTERHEKYLVFDPERASFRCDTQSCDEILDSSFEGLTRIPKEERSSDAANMHAGASAETRRELQRQVKEQDDAREDNPFFGFRQPDDEGNRYWNANVFKNQDDLIALNYDNWEGFEVQFGVFQSGAPIRGWLYGYYTEETLQNTTPYDLEMRDDAGSRLYHVSTLKGDVDLGLSSDETVDAKVKIGLDLKRPAKTIPFFIANAPSGENNYRRPSLIVNSIRSEGEELTWVRTSPFGGVVIFPEEVAVGTRLNLEMDFSTRAINKVNHAFSQLARFGWLPFVRFGDFIEEFEMTMRLPSEYKVLGVGHRASEETKDGITTSYWRADSPVVFPSVIFGKYFEDGPGDSEDVKARNNAGDEVPVTVHVDEVSLADWGIRPKQLRPIAIQAAVSINLYRDLSGVDYPYGELNLVNDPQGFLYGQAPSSLIYLGSGVFRGSGTIAQGSRTGSAGTSKFLRSVTAHEVGHQWWGSAVANSNFRNYWFVETLAEYFSALYLEQTEGLDDYQIQVEDWRRTILQTDLKTSVQNADALWAGEGFGGRTAAIYNKGPYMFHVLRRTFGDEKFFPALKQFTQELAGKREIVSRDIQVALERAFGGVGEDGKPYTVNLEWFFDQWLRGVGIPQFDFDYDSRRAEDGNWIVQGVIKQRLTVGSKNDMSPLKDGHFRGVVSITALAGKDEFSQRVIVDGPETPFAFKVPKKPSDVVLNKYGDMLTQDVAEYGF